MMSNKLLEIKNLHAGVAGREDKGEILQGLDLAIALVRFMLFWGLMALVNLP